MAQLDRPALHDEIEGRFPNNTTQQITPPIVRAFLHNLVDNTANLLDTPPLRDVHTFRFRTQAEAAGQFGGETLDQLQGSALYTYARVKVEFWRDDPADLTSATRFAERIAVFDERDKPDYLGWRTSGGEAMGAGRIGLRLVALEDPAATGVLEYNAQQAVPKGQPRFYDDGLGVQFYEAVKNLTAPVPAPVRDTVTASWKPIDTPPVPGTPPPTAGSTPSVQLTNTSVAQYVDVFLENKAAQLASVEGLANYAGQQMQVIDPANSAPFASENAYLPDVRASLAAAWAAGATRLLVRCQVLPLRNGLVAHARLIFSQEPTAWLQSLAPHASGFRLFGKGFQLQNVEWTHAASGMKVTGSTLENPGAQAVATGSPGAAYAGAATGLLAALEFTHNRNFAYNDFIGLSDAMVPNGANGTNFGPYFSITQANTWRAFLGSTELDTGSLATSQFRFRIEVYDDHIVWLVDGVIVYTMLGSLMVQQLWPSVSLSNGSGIFNCLFGGQTTSPR